MWVYKDETWKNEFHVGYLETRTDENGSYTVFEKVEIYADKDKAREAVNYLNGGNPEVQVSGVVYNKA